MNLVKTFLKEESGATAAEYGILIALIAVFIIGAVRLVGTNLNARFTDVSNALQ